MSTEPNYRSHHQRGVSFSSSRRQHRDHPRQCCLRTPPEPLHKDGVHEDRPQVGLRQSTGKSFRHRPPRSLFDGDGSDDVKSIVFQNDDENHRIFAIEPIPKGICACAQIPGYRIRYNRVEGWYALNSAGERLEKSRIGEMSLRRPDSSIELSEDVIKTIADNDGELDYAQGAWSYMYPKRKDTTSVFTSQPYPETGHERESIPPASGASPMSSRWGMPLSSDRPIYPTVHPMYWNQAPRTPFLQPGTFPAEPVGHPVPIKVHETLQFNSIDPDTPHLLWRIACHPWGGFAESARPLIGNLDFSTSCLKDDAVSPPRSQLTIDSDSLVGRGILASAMQNWGPIVVNAKDKKSVTVGEVPEAIYDYFRYPLTTKDRAIASISPKNMEAVGAAKRARALHGGNIPDFIMSGPDLRSDLMGGLIYFQGLRPELFPGNQLRLRLGLAKVSPVHRMLYARCLFRY